jgi:hypothetical protein
MNEVALREARRAVLRTLIGDDAQAPPRTTWASLAGSLHVASIPRQHGAS